MKRLVMTMLVFAAFLAAAGPDYSGIWQGKGAIESTKYPGGIPVAVQLTLMQAGTSVTGMVKVGNMAARYISTGSVIGNQVTFAIQSTSGRVTARLAENAGLLKGSMTLTDGEVYDVVFTRK